MPDKLTTTVREILLLPLKKINDVSEKKLPGTKKTFFSTKILSTKVLEYSTLQGKKAVLQQIISFS